MDPINSIPDADHLIRITLDDLSERLTIDEAIREMRGWCLPALVHERLQRFVTERSARIEAERRAHRALNEAEAAISRAHVALVALGDVDSASTVLGARDLVEIAQTHHDALRQDPNPIPCRVCGGFVTDEASTDLCPGCVAHREHAFDDIPF